MTGGAGYIGSFCVSHLLDHGCDVVIIDNLQEGHREAVSSRAVFYEGNIGDTDLLDSVFGKHGFEAVLHLAAETTVAASMTDPQPYFINNVAGGLSLLEAMRRHACRKIVFSSSAAVYGTPERIPIDEGHPLKPVNAYGESKAMFEKILEWYHAAYGLKFNAFRYFNAAGASADLGEDHRQESHLIPLLVRAALGKSKKISIFGSDYATRDGTCIRDYVHVIDIAQAHVLALRNLEGRPEATYNLGNGTGFTNLEVLRMVEKVSGRKVPYVFAPRRPGDPECLVASSELAHKELGWRAEYKSLESIVSSAWEWHSSHPNGYVRSDEDFRK